ncbi:MAG: hypothetical protein HYU39_10790 [Thaumarchaeota archaeon]|nr:hypothetical protein [Nitrososphaerota archaeon]
MKNKTVVAVALTVASIFASALLIPQFVMPQSPGIGGSSYYPNRNPQMGWGMMGTTMIRGMSIMPPQTYGNYTQGNGIMGSGMMNSMLMMKGMMGYYSEIPTPLSHDKAIKIAADYLVSLNGQDLVIDEFEEYSHNFYISLIEKSTGRGATEIIIDRYGGRLQPEPQSMMWNSKYGMMGDSQKAEMMVTPEQALKIAQDFLNTVYPGTKASEVVAYYGYYTIMTTLKGEHYGMLSINGYSGELWYHMWHGMFLSEVG